MLRYLSRSASTDLGVLTVLHNTSPFLYYQVLHAKSGYISCFQKNVDPNAEPRIRNHTVFTLLVNTMLLARPSSPVRQDGERRTTFLAEYAFRRVPFFSFWLILLFTLILFNLSKFIDYQ